MERSKVEHKQKIERMTKAHDLALKQMQEKQRNEMASLMSEVKLGKLTHWALGGFL